MSESDAGRERAHFDAHYGGSFHAGFYPPGLDGFRRQFAGRHRHSWQGGNIRSEVRLAALAAAEPSRSWSGIRVLDIGCGIGECAMWLAAEGASVEAFDLSPVACAVASEAAARYGLSDRVRFRAADAQRLPYDAGSFEVAIGWGVLHHVVKYPAAAAELARVLRPGGVIAWQETWGENPVLNLARRRWTLAPADAGDVMLTRKVIAEWVAGSPLRVERIQLFSIAYAVKRVIRPRRALQRGVLLGAYGMDLVLTRIPGLRRLGAEAVVVLRRQ
jgi:SAM-dependent methyltransferase